MLWLGSLLWKRFSPWPGTSWPLHADVAMKKKKEEEEERSLIPYTKINSKWIEDLNVILEAIKLLEKSIRRTVFDINHCIIFSHLPPHPKAKTKINK